MPLQLWPPGNMFSSSQPVLGDRPCDNPPESSVVGAIIKYRILLSDTLLVLRRDAFLAPLLNGCQPVLKRRSCCLVVCFALQSVGSLIHSIQVLPHGRDRFAVAMAFYLFNQRNVVTPRPKAWAA